MRVLITAFGPFPGTPLNESQAILAALDPGEVLPRCVASKRVLRTAYSALAELNLRMDDGGMPDLIVHLGVAQEATQFRLERTAKNRCGPAVDADGVCWNGRAIADQGPPTLQTPLPLAAIAATLAKRTLPVSVSNDAGSYLCNAVFFHTLWRTRDSATQAFFVHVPPSTSADSAASGARVIAEIIQETVTTVTPR